MIQSRLWAQLGNQCFMISAAIAHAKKMNTNYAFPRATLDPRVWQTYFKHLPVSNRATRDFYKQPNHAFNPLPESDDLTLEGYFISEKYFNNAKSELSDLFGFNMKPTDRIAIHVRRGDYLRFSDQFPPLPLEYYQKALKYFMDMGFNEFKVYSDDIPWCRQNFRSEKINFSFSLIKDPIHDMQDMHNNRGFIIANSTFSLFPAILRQDEPIVIAPTEDRWYGPKNKNLETFDLMPDRFIKI